MYENQVETAAARGLAAIDHRPPSLTSRLEQEKENLEKRLAELNEVLGQLKANPETQAILDSVARLGHLNY